MKRLLPGITIQPPGYTSARSLASILKAAGKFMLNVETWDEIIEGRYAIVGSPETVADTLIDSLGRLGTGNLLGLFQLGSLPHDLTTKNMQLFAEKVLPRLRAEFPEGAPVLPPVRQGRVMAEFTEEYVDTPDRQDPAVARREPAPQLVYLHSAGGENANPVARAARRVLRGRSYRSSPASRSPRGSSRSTGWKTRSSTCSTSGRSSASTRRRSSGSRSAAGSRSSSRPGIRRRSSKMVLVNPVGLHLDEAPIAEMFGRTPGELADMLFADQSYPLAAAMHAMDAFAGDVGKETEIPLELVLPMWKALGATARARLGPVPAQPEAARPPAAHHRADADRRRSAGRSRPADLRGDVRRGDPRRAPRGDRGRRALAAVREARRARPRSSATFLG